MRIIPVDTRCPTDQKSYAMQSVSFLFFFPNDTTYSGVDRVHTNQSLIRAIADSIEHSKKNDKRYYGDQGTGQKRHNYENDGAHRHGDDDTKSIRILRTTKMRNETAFENGLEPYLGAKLEVNPFVKLKLEQ